MLLADPALHNFYFKHFFQSKKLKTEIQYIKIGITVLVVSTEKGCDMIHLTNLFVCVEVLWSSQPFGVMSSMVSLPSHTFTG